VDTRATVDDVCRGLAASICETGATITVDPLPVVWADPAGLAQVFQNLIANALHSTRPWQSPRVHVSADRERGAWCFAVSDDGQGIAPEHHEEIFDVFTRLRRGDNRPGAGIGLATCRRLIERHGGRLWVESALGAGSTFFFNIPDRTTQVAMQGGRPQ
jgi:signal transduction histidine kinase